MSFHKCNTVLTYTKDIIKKKKTHILLHGHINTQKVVERVMNPTKPARTDDVGSNVVKAVLCITARTGNRTVRCKQQIKVISVTTLRLPLLALDHIDTARVTVDILLIL